MRQTPWFYPVRYSSRNWWLPRFISSRKLSLERVYFLHLHLRKPLPVEFGKNLATSPGFSAKSCFWGSGFRHRQKIILSRDNFPRTHSPGLSSAKPSKYQKYHGLRLQALPYQFFSNPSMKIYTTTWRHNYWRIFSNLEHSAFLWNSQINHKLNLLMQIALACQGPWNRLNQGNPSYLVLKPGLFLA